MPGAGPAGRGRAVLEEQAGHRCLARQGSARERGEAGGVDSVKLCSAVQQLPGALEAAGAAGQRNSVKRRLIFVADGASEGRLEREDGLQGPKIAGAGCVLYGTRRAVLRTWQGTQRALRIRLAHGGVGPPWESYVGRLSLAPEG